MDKAWSRLSARRTAALGVLAGTLVGSTVLVVTGSAIAQRGAGSIEPYVEVTHLPRLLTTGGGVDLEYEAYCVDPGADEASSTCDVAGTAFVRPGASGEFREFPLTQDGTTSRLSARVPESIAKSREGFSYYAELTGPDRISVTLPAGGSAAPHRSLPLGEALQVDLGTHRFGMLARASERVATASWGDGPDDAGLEGGLSVAPIGASAFDVDERRTVALLDHAHGRMLLWHRGATSPTRVPIEIDGTIADLTLAPDGTIYVLESVGRGGHKPLVRRFDSRGRSLGSTEIAERTPSQIRLGAGEPVVLQQPSQQWMPVATAGSLVGPDGQRRGGRSGRPVGSGTEIVVLREANEIRVALAGPNGVQRSWRITSATPLAEVQLAEPLGNRLVLVVRVYTDDRDEFVVLVLDRRGLRQSFALDSAEWAEAAPLARFRLVGSSLFVLGSTAAHVFVDRFDLEVR